jgi:uncharacterized membrane protein YhaH (DUF805 family)
MAELLYESEKRMRPTWSLLTLSYSESRRSGMAVSSGWWMLIAFTIIGLIPLIIWLASKGNDRSNKYGDPV